MMIVRSSCCLVAVAMMAAAPLPAHAYKWPGHAPSPGGAIAAKVIGQSCSGVMTQFEVAELDAYIAKSERELDARSARLPEAQRGRPFADFATSLSATYVGDFRKPCACNGSAEEEARDMLQRVRRVMVSSAPLFPDETHPSWRPDVSDAATARLVADKCRTDFTAGDVAALDVYMANAWSRWVAQSIEADARVTMDLHAQHTRDALAAWTDAGCSSDAIAKTRHTLSRLK